MITPNEERNQKIQLDKTTNEWRWKGTKILTNPIDNWNMPWWRAWIACHWSNRQWPMVEFHANLVHWCDQHCTQGHSMPCAITVQINVISAMSGHPRLCHLLGHSLILEKAIDFNWHCGFCYWGARPWNKMKKTIWWTGHSKLGTWNREWWKM